MIKKIFIVASFVLLPAIVFSEEIVARAETWGWTISVNAEGNGWEKSCKLKLVAETYQLKQEINLKRQGVNCALFGPVHLYAAEAIDRESVMVFFEARRGGDGDHSGPIVEVFKLTKQGFKKLGEQELFDATYQRKDEQIMFVTGSVLYSFCRWCDGPEASDPDDNFYVPAKMTVESSSFSVKPTLSKQERKALLEKFDERAEVVIKENDFDQTLPVFIKSVREELSSFLRR